MNDLDFVYKVNKFEDATIAIWPIKNGKNSIFEEVNYFPY